MMNDPLANFKNGDKIFVPCWDCEWEIELEEPVARSIEMLRAILAHDGEMRKPFILGAFDYYRQEVYGSVTQAVAPLVTEPEQVWPMLKPLYLDVQGDCYDEGHVVFSLTFACQWDEEYGIGVRYVDWEIVLWVGDAGL